MNITKNRIALESLAKLIPQNSKALTINPNKISYNNNLIFSSLLAKFFTFCLLGMVLLTACRKEDDLLPSTSTGNLNDPYLKAGSPTFYIDPSGSDAAIGDITHPWKTLSYACSQVTTPGNIIHVNAGTYNETQRCNLAVGVSIIGEGIQSVINITYVNGGDDKNAGILLSSYGSLANGNQSISHLKINGGSVNDRQAISVLDRSNVSVHHCTIINFNNGGVKFFALSTYASGNNVHDCILNDCGIHANQAANVWLDRQADALIYNNSFNNTGRTLGSNGNIIGGLSGTKGLKIHDNTFTKNDFESNEWNFFIELWYLSEEYEVYNNVI